MATLQGSLFTAGEPEVREGTTSERLWLDERAWVDLLPGWLAGADGLMEHLADAVEWHQGRRWMYDRMVDDPRLSRWFGEDEPLPHPVLAQARSALGRRYGVRFGAAGLNYYRDGRDSVAPHRDRELRHLEDTLVAIVTLGAARAFRLRPVGGGESVQLRPASGDLIVMGGGCQARWEHSVPKVATAEPRVSVSFRWSSGRGAAVSPPRRPERRQRSMSPRHEAARGLPRDQGAGT